MAKIPDGAPDDMAVYCCDMLSTGFMGAENGNIPIGGTVAVLAQGPVRLMATAGARLRGAGLIIGVESVPERQELARTYGADEIVDFTKEDVAGRIMDLTDGEGVDTAIEALGADVTFQAAVKATKPGGTVSNTGYFGKGEFVPIPRVEWGVGMADKTIATGLCPGGRLRMSRLLRVLESGRVDPTLMTTHTFSFDDMDLAAEDVGVVDHPDQPGGLGCVRRVRRGGLRQPRHRPGAQRRAGEHADPDRRGMLLHRRALLLPERTEETRGQVTAPTAGGTLASAD
jgi:isopropanol dehydrogenase (NADP+)